MRFENNFLTTNKNEQIIEMTGITHLKLQKDFNVLTHLKTLSVQASLTMILLKVCFFFTWFKIDMHWNLLV